LKIGLECIPCFVRQAFDAVILVTNDEKIRERILRQVLFRLANVSFDNPPPYIGRDIHRIIKLLSGNSDPYLEIKKDSNTLAIKLMPSLKKLIKRSSDSFETAVRLAIAGNIIDCVRGDHLSEKKIQKTISQCLDQPLSKDTIDELRREIGKASNILYLGDNSGEVFFDKLFIDELQGNNITFVVRGAPIINDALMDDARMAGLDRLVRVLDNGSDVPGTILEECSDEFKRYFMEADLVIAKGQGNFETLRDDKKKIFFLFKVKCPVIADYLGCEEEDSVIVENNRSVDCV